MLGRGNVAEEIRSACCGDCSADCRGDVVVTGCDIGYKRSENIERRVVADALLELHVRFDLVHRHVAGSLDHYLNVLCPCAFGKSAELYKLADLSGVGAVVDTAGTERVSEADCNVKFSQDLKHVVVELIERVFVACHHHPRKQQ